MQTVVIIDGFVEVLDDRGRPMVVGPGSRLVATEPFSALTRTALVAMPLSRHTPAARRRYRRFVPLDGFDALAAAP
ncbi:hypothetical protein BH10ACT3_BH10ACT3_20430 [soil metagenome]